MGTRIWVNAAVAALALAMVLLLASPYAVTNAQLSPSAPVYRTCDRGEVSLVIALSWDASALSGLLDSLDKAGVKASFAVTGELAKANPELVRLIEGNGHETLVLASGMEPASAAGAVGEASGKAPYAVFCGDRDPALVARVAKGSGLRVIAATVDLASAEGTFRELVNRAGNVSGGMILAAEPTESLELALPEILEKIKNMGLDIVPTHKMLYNNNGGI
ncbi:MAG: hypothetical protein J5772_02185 [Clostridia bacterium]|nr:hypothetical protein [Clostridia bacterium]